MKKNPQKNKVTNAQLRSVAKNHGLQQSLNNIFSASFSPDDDVIRKFNYISSLIGDNIRKSKDSANKRSLQKLEHSADDLEKAQAEIKKLTQQLEDKTHEKDNTKDKRSLE